MDPQILAFVLLLCGFILLFAEMFIPSGGIIGVICVLCFGGAVYFAFQAWYHSQPLFWWTYLVSVAILVPLGIIGAFRLLTHSPLGNRVLLRAPSQEEVTPYQRESQHLSGMIGKRGVTMNLMTPGGLVKVEGERLHAISEGLMIEPQTEIEVVAVRGTRVVVRPVEEIECPSDDLAFDDTDENEVEPDPWSNEPPA